MKWSPAVLFLLSLFLITPTLANAEEVEGYVIGVASGVYNKDLTPDDFTLDEVEIKIYLAEEKDQVFNADLIGSKITYVRYQGPVSRAQYWYTLLKDNMKRKVSIETAKVAGEEFLRGVSLVQKSPN